MAQLFFLLMASPLAYAFMPQAGDLFFADMPCYACEAIKKTTHSPFSHVAIIEQNSDGTYSLIMSVEPKTISIDLSAFIRHLEQVSAAKGIKVPMSIMRFKSFSGKALAARAAHVARGFLGVPYDDEYLPGMEKLYCAELLYYSFKIANGGVPFFRMTPMHFGENFSEWYQIMGHAPPEGVMGISPGDMARVEGLETVWSK